MQNDARRHAVELRQCSLFASDLSEHIAKAMTDAADYLDQLAAQAAKGERETIVAAAVQFGATISLPPPARHHTIIQTMDKEMGIDGYHATPQAQGFLTSSGRFVNRVEGFYLAHAAGQIISDTQGPQLFSEDLW